MPVNRDNYPTDWDKIAHVVKEAAGWRCPQCDVLCKRPGENVCAAVPILTVAHWDHDTSAAEVFVAALCGGCHNRHDAYYRAADRKRRKDEERRRADFMRDAVRLRPEFRSSNQEKEVEGCGTKCA